MKKLILIILLLGLIFALAIRLNAWRSDQLSELASAQEQFEALRTRLTSTQKELSAYDGYDGILGLWSGQSEGDILTLVQATVSEAINANNLRLVSLQPLSSDPIAQIQTVGVRGEFRGSLSDLARFFGALEQNKQRLFVQAAVLRKLPIQENGQEDQLNVQVDLSAPYELRAQEQ